MSDQNVALVTNQYGDVYINAINDTHFKKLSAREIVTAILLTKLNEEATFYIIIGTDSGLLPKYLNELPHKEKSKFLFIELDIVLPIIENQFNYEEMENITITSFDDWRDAALRLGIEPYLYNDKVKLIASLAASEGHIDNYTELFPILEQAISSLSYEFNTKTYNYNFLRQSLINLADNIYPAEVLRNTAKGQALILGAGPSLANHITWIKNHQKNITIFSVSRIIDYLISKEITPDFIVSVDPQEVNYESGKQSCSQKNSILIHSNSVSFRLQSQFQGKKLYLGNKFFWKSTKNSQNLDSFGPTVTHTATLVAMQMGFEKIYLAGVDFCFTPEGKTHVAGIPRKQKNHHKPLEVMTYDEKFSETHHDFLLSIRRLELLAKIFNGKIYNLSKEAAKCEGITLAEYPEETSPKYALSKTLDFNENHILNHLMIAKKELTKAQKSINAIKMLSEEALELNEKWPKASSQDKAEKIKFKIDKIENKLNSRKHENYINTCRVVGGRNLYSLVNKAREEKTIEHEYDWMKQYYQSHYNGCKKILDAIVEAEKIIDYRLTEFTPSTSIEKLLKIWSEQNIPGRSCVFKDSELYKKKSKVDQEKIDIECQNFLSSLKITNQK